MRGHPPRPSRAILSLLRLVSSSEAASAVAGDILEELNERRTNRLTPLWTTLWLNWRLLEAVMAFVWTATPRALRSAGYTVRDAARALRRAPAHALFILLILAVGICTATVTFSVVDAVVLAPLPFDHAEDIVQVSGRNRSLPGQTSLAPEEFWAIHDRVTGFDSLASARHWTTPVRVTSGDATEELTAMHSTAELFRVLRLEPLMGRVWTTEDERQGDLHVALISFAFWQRRFGGDPGVLGRGLRIEDAPYRVVGVLPASAGRSETIGWTNDVWIPQVPPREGTPNGVSRSIFAIGRIRDGVSLAQLTAEVQSVVVPLAAAKPYAYTDWRPEVRRWREALAGTARGWMLLVLAAVALVLLIACVNAANVMLIRSAERSRELAVRASLGASRRQLAMGLLAESVLLSIAASICALIFAGWGIGAARTALPGDIFRAATISLNGRVFAASILAALVTGVLFGMVPAWQASRLSITTLLKDAGTTATAGRRRWHSTLLIVEVACVAVLLVASTLFVASFIRVMRVDLGVDRSNLLALTPHTEFSGTVADVESRLRQIPGVADVAVVTRSSLPLAGWAFGGAFSNTRILPVDGVAGQAPVNVVMYRVTPNYFAVAGMNFRRGSTWPAAPARESPAVVLDELAARALFGDRDPVGLRVRGDDPKRLGEFTVVGVVPSVRASGPERDAQPTAYLANVPSTTRRSASLFVRTSRPADELVPVVETALAPMAPLGAPPYVHTVDQAVRNMTETRRFNARLMSSFAVIAILIGAAGIYAVMASVVAQRTREIGVRIALGATAGDIRRGVLAQAAGHLLLGLTVGLLAAWWISRAFGALLFEVRPSDLSVYVIVTLTLLTVGLIAASVPARRAARVDPIVSLRST
jgi:putative ABC transport system permease protein